MIAVKFPKEKGKKVNISRFLKRFKKFRPSLLVEVPDDEAPHVIEVLRRNNCEIQILKPALRDFEEKMLKEMLDLVKRIRAGKEEPKALGKFAVEKIKIFSIEEMSDKVSDILHLAIEFEENPSILILNEIERKIRSLL